MLGNIFSGCREIMAIRLRDKTNSDVCDSTARTRGNCWISKELPQRVQVGNNKTLPTTCRTVSNTKILDALIRTFSSGLGLPKPSH